MIDVVIVNWNSGEYLQKCVNSIFRSSHPDLIKSVYIIDNNSSDHSVQQLPENNKIKLILNSDNNGFAKACNQGFTKCTTEYTLLLNPDAQLYESTLNDCTLFMDKNPEIDILGCRLINDFGHTAFSCARFPRPERFINDALGLTKINPKVFKSAVLMLDWDHNNSRKVDQVMGAFMFMRTDVFKKIGYFDEQFFVYYEELDFSKRLAEAGGISFYNSEIKAVHSGEGTTASVKPFRLFLNLHSRLKYAKKHFSSAGFVFVAFLTLFIEPVTRGLFLILKGKIKESREVFKGYSMLFRRLFKF
ncbi:N/A [soil metagenome]